MPLTTVDQITALSLTSGILKRMGLDFQSKQILVIATDKIMSFSPHQQPELMKVLNLSYRKGME